MTLPAHREESEEEDVEEVVPEPRASSRRVSVRGRKTATRGRAAKDDDEVKGIAGVPIVGFGKRRRRAVDSVSPVRKAEPESESESEDEGKSEQSEESKVEPESESESEQEEAAEEAAEDTTEEREAGRSGGPMIMVPLGTSNEIYRDVLPDATAFDGEEEDADEQEDEAKDLIRKPSRRQAVVAAAVKEYRSRPACNAASVVAVFAFILLFAVLAVAMYASEERATAAEGASEPAEVPFMEGFLHRLTTALAKARDDPIAAITIFGGGSVLGFVVGLAFVDVAALL